MVNPEIEKRDISGKGFVNLRREKLDTAKEFGELKEDITLKRLQRRYTKEEE